ncbi:MAG: site-2 protease family protein [Thermoplasmata archaeon]
MARMERSMQSSPVPDAAAEVDFIKSIVSRYFSIYETNLSHDSVSFKCQVNQDLLEDNFKRLRAELAKYNYTPVITYRGGEHTITVGKLPKPNPRGVWVNVIMMIFTLSTTIFAGMILWSGYVGDEVEFFSAETVLMGALTFGVPILLILGTHEMGHYLTAKRSGLSASLPFFIPAPPPIGTFGAFISIREPIPDRKTLFNLGVSGPIAGFLVAVPVAILGLILTAQGARPIPEETGGSMYITLPVIYDIIGLFIPLPENYILHPTAMAGWVGFLVTAINLIPAGSLDGGHVARAILGHNSRYLSWASVFILFSIGAFFNVGWMLFGLIVLFLGMEHAPPLNDITKISGKKKALGALMGVILVTSFVLVPMGYVEMDYSFDAELQGSDEGNVSMMFNHTFPVLITSTGNVNTELRFDLAPSSVKNLLGYGISYYNNLTGSNVSSPSNEATVKVGRNMTVYFTVHQKEPVSQQVVIDAAISIYAKNDTRFSRSLPIKVTLLSGNYTFVANPSSTTIGKNQTKSISIEIDSSYQFLTSVELLAVSPAGWSAWLYSDDPGNATNRLIVSMPPLSNISVTLVVSSPADAITGKIVTIWVEAYSAGTGLIERIAVELTVI